MTRPFLLIHGGLHGAACWGRTAERLSRNAREAIAFDLPGHGADTTPREKVGMSSYVAEAERMLASLEAPAIVVAHSMGGMVGTVLAARQPEKVAALIYVTAVVPPGAIVRDDCRTQSAESIPAGLAAT